MTCARIRSRALVALVLLTAGLAGCLASDAPPDVAGPADGAGNETEMPAVPARMSFGACDVQAGVFDVPAVLAAEKAPPGFTPTSAVEPDGPTASFVVDAHDCGNATSDAFDGTEEDVGWVAYFLAVDPPDEYEDESVDFYLLPVAAVTDAPQVLDVYEAWNLTFEEGTVDMTATTAPTARRGQLEVRSDNISSTLHTAVSSEVPSEDPDHRSRVFGVSDGKVTSIVDFDVSGSDRFMGGAERIVEPGSSAPGDLPLWAAENALTRGVGQHIVAERIDIQPLDPAEVAG